MSNEQAESSKPVDEKSTVDHVPWILRGRPSCVVKSFMTMTEYTHRDSKIRDITRLFLSKPTDTTKEDLYRLMVGFQTDRVGMVVVNHENIAAIENILRKKAEELGTLFAIHKRPKGFVVVWVQGEWMVLRDPYPFCDAHQLCIDLKGNMSYTALCLHEGEYWMDVGKTKETSEPMIIGAIDTHFRMYQTLENLMNSIKYMEHFFASGKGFPTVFMQNALKCMHGTHSSGDVCAIQSQQMLLDWLTISESKLAWNEAFHRRYWCQKKLPDTKLTLPMWSDECTFPVVSPEEDFAAVVVTVEDTNPCGEEGSVFEETWSKLAEEIAIGAMTEGVPCVGILFSPETSQFMVIGLCGEDNRRDIGMMRGAIHSAVAAAVQASPETQIVCMTNMSQHIAAFLESQKPSEHHLFGDFGIWRGNNVRALSVDRFHCRSIRTPWIRNWLFKNVYDKNGWIKENAWNLLRLARKWEQQEQQRLDESQLDLTNRKRPSGDQETEEEPAAKRAHTEK